MSGMRIKQLSAGSRWFAPRVSSSSGRLKCQRDDQGYISVYWSCILISLPIKSDITGPSRVGQRPDRDNIHPGFSDPPHRVQVYPARSLN